MRSLFLITFILLNNPLFSQNNGGVHCQPLNVSYITDILVSNENKVWISSFGIKALTLLQDTSFTYFGTTNSPLHTTYVYDLEAEDDQYIWIATRDGLYRTDGTDWKTYDTSNSGLPDDNVASVHYYDGKVVAGTRNGAAVLQSGQWTIYNTQNSPLASDTILAVRFVNKELYIANTGGLSILQDDEWQNYSATSTGIPLDSIHSIKSYKNEIYFSAGIHRIFKWGRKGFEEIELNLLQNVRFNEQRLDIPFDIDDQGNIYIAAEYIKYPFTNYVYSLICKIHPGTKEYQFFITPLASVNHVSVTDNGDYIFTGKICKISTQDYVQQDIIFTNNNVKFLDINNVSAPVANNGMMYGFDTELVSYTVPKNSTAYYSPGNATTGTIWTSAMDEQGNYYAAAGDRYAEYNDFMPGPIDLSGSPPDYSWSQAPYSNIWKVDINDINNFKAFKAGDTSCFNYQVPGSIASWPGNGESPFAQELAPFVDVNNNGIYEPGAGEYPEIKGDQMLWWVYNDLGRGYKSWGGSTPMKLEYHASAYAYSCPDIVDSLQVINNTTFYKYKVLNRSNRHYKDAYIGLVTDISVYQTIGNAFGTDPANNSAFVYTRLPWFGDTPATDPMMNIVVLNGPEAVPNDGIDNNNNGIKDEPGEKALMTFARRASVHFGYSGYLFCEMPHWGWTDTDTARMSHYFLSGRTSDGSLMRRNNEGCEPSDDTTSPTFRHVFDGVPYSGSGWYNYDGGGNEDNRYLLSAGPFDFAPGEEVEFEYAVVFTWDTTGPNGLHTSIATNSRDVMQIIKWYENNSFPDCSEKVDPDQFKIPRQTDAKIYPNPADDEIYIHYNKQADNALSLIFDLQGRLRKGNQMDCCGKTRIDINMLEPGTYFLKIIDGDNVVVKKFVKAP